MLEFKVYFKLFSLIVPIRNLNMQHLLKLNCTNFNALKFL